jgi:hypothetical protein
LSLLGVYPLLNLLRIEADAGLSLAGAEAMQGM